MPANIVKPGEEAAWDRAKQATKKQYPSLSEENDRFWKITTTIFNNMKTLNKNCTNEHCTDASCPTHGGNHSAPMHKSRRVILGVFARRR